MKMPPSKPYLPNVIYPCSNCSPSRTFSLKSGPTLTTSLSTANKTKISVLTSSISESSAPCIKEPMTTWNKPATLPPMYSPVIKMLSLNSWSFPTTQKPRERIQEIKAISSKKSNKIFKVRPLRLNPSKLMLKMSNWPNNKALTKSTNT